jgi:hypothetical protein
MHIIEDYRKNKKGDDDDGDGDEEGQSGHVPRLPLDPSSEEVVLDDSEALKLGGKNPLAEEEGEKNAEDDNGGD